jgi:radical SAM protein with 4Fe4S-binding SPASM domain
MPTHRLGEYIYDPDRLVFYKKDLDAEAIAEIHAYVKVDDDYDSVRKMLNAYDASEIRIRPGALKKAGICLTNNCNFRCGYCSASSLEGNIEPIRLEDVFAFVSDVMKRWTVNKLVGNGDEPLSLDFTGGEEPTYDWSLFRDAVTGIRQKARNNGIPLTLGITTNGLLDGVKTEFVTGQFESVMVSYDGMPAIQNKNRCCARLIHTSDAVEQTIRSLSKKTLHLTIRTTIWQDDFRHMKAMADHIFGNFGDSVEWSILPVVPAGRALRRAQKTRGRFEQCEFLRQYLETVDHARQKYGPVAISTPIFRGDITTVFCGAISAFCSCPWLLPDKTIITCIESCAHKTVIGRVDDGRVEYFDKCQDPLFKMYQEKFDECRSCIAYRFCKGGCPVRHLTNRDARTAMGDWECSMIRSYWEHVFAGVLEGERRLGWCAVPVKIGGVERLGVLKLTRAG